MYQRILVPIDGSPASECALQEALGLAHAMDARLDILHVIDERSLASALEAYTGYAGEWATLLQANGQALLDAALDRAARAGVEASITLNQNYGGPVHEVVIQQAHQRRSKLIVMGTHGRRGPDRYPLGRDAELVLRHAPVPVLLIRAAERGADAGLPIGTVAAETAAA
jgi:nucleotide-binding universal stress UspA family protein